MTQKEIPCPEARTPKYMSGVNICALNTKYCIKDTDHYCETYEDYLFELKQEEVDKMGGQNEAKTI